MKTDTNFYLLFQAKPDLLQTITGYSSHNASFESINLKTLTKQLDGILRPKDPDKPQVVIEFQGYFDKRIYERVLLETHWLCLQDDRDTYGMIIFLLREHDPKTRPWFQLAQSSEPNLEHVYLMEVLQQAFGDDLEKLTTTKAELAVFAPLLLEDEALKRLAAKAYRLLESADLTDIEQEVFQKVFINWMYERFTEMTKEEVKAMIELRTPLQETRAYRDIAEEAVEQAKPKIIEDAAPKIIEDAAPKIIEDAAPRIIEDAKPKIMLELLQKQLRDGVISQEDYDTYTSGLNGRHI